MATTTTATTSPATAPGTTRGLAEPRHPVVVGSVVGMLLAISLGRLALVGLGHEDLQPALVVLAVGLHFVPFARAFRAPLFGTLGWVVATLGALGLVGGAVVGAVAPRAAAVVAGLVMLGLVGLEQWRGGTAVSG